MKKIILEVLKRSKWIILFEIIFIIINILLTTYPAKIIGEIIDLMYNMDEFKNIILQKTGIMLAICIGILVVRTIWKYLEISMSNIFVTTLRNNLFEKLMKIHLEELKDIKNGQIMSYFVSDIKAMRAFVSRVISTVTRIILTGIIVIGTMSINVNINLTFAIIIPIIVTTIIIVILKSYVEKNYKNAQKQFTDMSEYVQESTDSIRTTKAYVGEDKQTEEFIVKNKNVKNSNNKLEIYSNLLHTVIQTCVGICYGISIIYGSNLVLQSKITVGDLVAFNGYIALIVGPMAAIPWIVNKYKRAVVSYNRLNDVFSLKEEDVEINENKVKYELQGHIKIDNLTYTYPGTKKEVLKDINLEIKPGENLGIIGVLGSGKTTLANLLLKLYRVKENKIYIDGKDINDIDTKVLRENICYITQENFLFSTSLKENISLFREEYKDEEIENSTKNAIIYDDILQMPENINTIIGEKGIDLSGGQKQRVVISRAFLKKSNILIFDDTFSALDNRTQASLLKNIKKLTKDKSCIIISNRISDIKECDEIIVLEKGKIVERGKHEELINNKNKYYKFYKDQISKPEDSILA
ncbi:MAG: ABC transporter ATP-binding protein [Clostridia bacterium]|nr:ABC transporter ATP-binding protein [Clostridia bacterium]